MLGWALQLTNLAAESQTPLKLNSLFSYSVFFGECHASQMAGVTSHRLTSTTPFGTVMRHEGNEVALTPYLGKMMHFFRTSKDTRTQQVDLWICSHLEGSPQKTCF